MNLLILGPDIKEKQRIKNFTGNVAHYLCKELHARGVGLKFARVKLKAHDPQDMRRYLETIDGSGCDHALALQLRWFTHQPLGCPAIVQTKVPGAVTQMHDGVCHDYLAPYLEGVACTFMFRDDGSRMRDWGRYAPTNHYVGWGSDPDLLYPEQSQRELRILIDHVYYKGGTPDISNAVAHDVMNFVREGHWKFDWESVKVRRLVNGGAGDVTFDNVEVLPFDRKHIPYPDICKEYRKAHIYICTHKESVGLSCLELATCGALVVTAHGFIYKDRLETMRYIEYAGSKIPWSVVLGSIDVGASAAKAREQTWSKVADRMLDWFAAYKG